MAPRCFFTGCKGTPTHHVVQNWNGKTHVCCDKHVPGSRLRELPTDHTVRQLAERLNAYTVTTLGE